MCQLHNPTFKCHGKTHETVKQHYQFKKYYRFSFVAVSDERLKGEGVIMTLLDFRKNAFLVFANAKNCFALSKSHVNS